MRWLIPLLLLMAHPAYAADLILTVTPQAPQPGEIITVRAQVPREDQDALFSWTVDGTEVASGFGQSSVQVPMPELGTSVEVQVRVDGEERADPLILRPQRVTIEWEGLSTRPPMYMGRPLFMPRGEIRAHAVAELITARNTRIPNTEIKYTWSINDAPLRESGYGKDTVRIAPPVFNRPFTLNVRAETRSGLIAEDTVSLSASLPSLMVYELSPLRGLTEHAVRSEIALRSSEVTFIAYALYAPTELIYSWTLNRQPVTVSGDDPRVVTFRRTGEGIGQYQIGVNAQNGQPFGSYNRSFLLNF